MLKIYPPRTSPTRRHIGTLIRNISPKTLNYKIANSSVFQAHIWWNKTENNVIKMQLYGRFKIDALGTSHGRHPTEVF